MQLTRRSLLLAGLGVAAAGCASWGSDTGRVSGSFSSREMNGARVGWTIGYPPGHSEGEELPVVISLHGRGSSHRTTFRTLRLEDALAEVVRDGIPPFAIASVDGGHDAYWHRRANGTMLRTEFLPLLHSRNLVTSRLGLYGWSMGGYGALLLAGRHQLPVRAVAVSSPALFTSAGATTPGAFDDPADFDRNDVYAHPEWMAGIPLRIDCGQSDPFFSATRDYAARLRPHPAGSFGPGRHDPAYWRKVAPAQLRFLGRRISG